MDTNGSGTDYNALSRLGTVDSGDCDDLADVFLGPSPAEDATDPKSDPLDEGWAQTPAATEPRVLQLVVGSHLKNADDLFARLCESQSVDPDRAIGCIQYGPAGWSARLIGRTHRFNGHRASVAHAINQVSAVSDRVNVLLPPHHEIGELIEGLDNLADPPDAIIVLTTAIESDVVAAYRQLKSIASFCPDQLARCEVVMIAEPDEEATAALDRLLGTAARFLEAPVVGQIIAASDPGQTSAPAPDVPEPRQEVIAESEATAAPDVETSEPMPEPTPVPAPTFADSHDDAETTLLASLTRDMELLDLRCPDAPRVVLAVDQVGRIHAFASMIEAQGLETESSPLEALARARAFVARHMPMLAPLDPRVRAEAGTPQTHLVSDHFAQLEPCLGTDIRLHLAVPVRVAGQTIWGVSELRTD